MLRAFVHVRPEETRYRYLERLNRGDTSVDDRLTNLPTDRHRFFLSLRKCE